MRSRREGSIAWLSIRWHRRCSAMEPRRVRYGDDPATYDDGEAAQGRGLDSEPRRESRPPAAIAEPDGYADWLDRLHVLAAEGTARLDRAWQDSTPGHKNHLLRTAPETWREFKLIAARRIA